MVNVNANDMWKKIEQLGPQCKRAISIPMEVIINNKMMTDQKLVLQKWRDDFAGLYKGVPSGTLGYDESFLKQAKMTLRELDLKDLSNDDSFKSITQSEILAMTQHIKNGKAVSVDKIPNEVLKNEACIDILCMFTEGFHT